MNKIPYFFLILLTAVLVFISAKSEGFDISRNFYEKSEGFDTSHNYVKGPIGPTGPTGLSEKDDTVIMVFTPGNTIVFTIGIILFIIMIILIVKLNSITSS